VNGCGPGSDCYKLDVLLKNSLAIPARGLTLSFQVVIATGALLAVVMASLGMNRARRQTTD
jgi:hypothetical protein